MSRRLDVVQGRLRDLLSTGAIKRVLSLCAGDGRDVIPLLADRPPQDRPEAVLVELDEALAARARQRASDAAVAITVMVGDAGSSQTWSSVLPVDLLMLCGIFGNVSDEDILGTVRAVPSMLSPNGVVIWTRGSHGDHDVRPQIRRWFEDAGFSEIAFDQEAVGYGVGVNRLTSSARVSALPDRLFSFVR